jgi:glycosyltransferase involved in cell wall biosynthesis
MATSDSRQSSATSAATELVVKRPKVTVVMPCLDEARFIPNAVASLLGGSFADLELLIVDGGSQDGTRERVDEMARADPRVRRLDNPLAITPCALNVGIRAARGDIIVRADAHATYPRDYVERLVRALDESGADLVGGGQEALSADRSAVATVIALAHRGTFATASPHRNRRTAGSVDTVFLGCWRRGVFDRVGLFDERLARNQDNEHASRIRRLGGRVHFVPEVRVPYFPRPSLRRFWRQAAETGMWNAFTQCLRPYTFTWRHFLPGPFFLAVLFCFALVVVGALRADWRLSIIGVALLAPYLLLDIISAIAQTVRARRPLLAPLLAFVVASHHFVYGYGICKGWVLVASGGWRRRLGRPARTGR